MEFIGIKSVSHIIFMLLICKTHKVTTEQLEELGMNWPQVEAFFILVGTITWSRCSIMRKEKFTLHL